MSDRWFRFGKKINDYHVRALRQKGNQWQLYETKEKGYLLVTQKSLYQRWIDEGWIGKKFLSAIEEIDKSQKYFYLFCGFEFAVGCVSIGDSFSGKETAVAFKIALLKARKHQPSIPLGDALFLEKYQLLLPSYESKEDVPDDILLGMWVSGGVRVSIKDIDRVAGLSAVLTKQDTKEIVGEELRHAFKSEDAPIQRRVLSKEDRFELPGRPELETFFNDHIIDIVKNEERYKRMGIDFPGAVILYGPPGCGKTYAVEKLVKFLGWPLHTISSGTIGSSYLHETSKKIAAVFDRAINDAPSVVVIDEMESFLADRSNSGYSGNYQIEEVGEFLRKIPEATKNHVLIFGMTNLINKVDPAIRRRGRFDHIIEVGMPSATEVRSLLDHLLKDIPVADGLSREKLSTKLEGRAVSDTAFVVKEACRVAAKKGLDAVDQSCFERAIKGLPDDTEERKPIGFIWE